MLTVNRHLLAIPRFRFKTYGRRAFSVAGPMAWNSLPDFIRDPVSSTDCFRRLLKTYTCSHDTSASSALRVLNDHALYKSTHSFTYSLIPTMPLWLCTCNKTWWIFRTLERGKGSSEDTRICPQNATFNKLAWWLRECSILTSDALSATKMWFHWQLLLNVETCMHFTGINYILRSANCRFLFFITAELSPYSASMWLFSYIYSFISPSCMVAEDKWTSTANIN